MMVLARPYQFHFAVLEIGGSRNMWKGGPGRGSQAVKRGFLVLMNAGRAWHTPTKSNDSIFQQSRNALSTGSSAAAAAAAAANFLGDTYACLA